MWLLPWWLAGPDRQICFSLPKMYQVATSAWSVSTLQSCSDAALEVGRAVYRVHVQMQMQATSVCRRIAATVQTTAKFRPEGEERTHAHRGLPLLYPIKILPGHTFFFLHNMRQNIEQRLRGNGDAGLLRELQMGRKPANASRCFAV